MDTNKHLFSDDDNKHNDKSSSSSIPIGQKPFESNVITRSNDTLNTDNPSLEPENMKIIDLNSSSLRESGIIDSLNLLLDKNILQIRFSGLKYNNRTIILSTNLAHSDWIKFANICRKTLEQKGIEKSDIETILNSLDSSFEAILGGASSKTITKPDNNSKLDFKSISDRLLEVAKEKIDSMLVDQYGEAFVQVNVNNDHLEIMPISKLSLIS
ncbi:MAG: hypothetical protein L0H53_10875 [Candidatus Nitrosocosmicus sp.]|nr:hypothetical protein [Candidatus Nitrosocosmicus sp.]MDN5868806.1 hypothetical protein [Candidatus Nitrosocosmicus sp.]